MGKQVSFEMREGFKELLPDGEVYGVDWGTVELQMTDSGMREGYQEMFQGRERRW